ncbi:MAG TPA: PAS domain S-box protein, partial [Acidimicrobiia bacterium]|nr:PAS domain S-box protein [Acidimicrobiia bacterium]
MEEPKSLGASLWARATDPACFAVFVVVPLFYVAREFGFIAPVPLWILFGCFFAGFSVSVIGAALFWEARSGWQLWGRVGSMLLAITVIMYSIGWGPTLAIGFLYGAVATMGSAGSNAMKPSIVLSVVGIALGELAIALGIAPTLIDQPLVHGLALLAACGVWLTIRLYGQSQVAMEQAQAELQGREEHFKALVQHASDVIMVIARDGTYQYVSPAFESVLGYDVDASVGVLGREMANPDDVEALLAGGAEGTTRGEVRMRHADGTWMWFDVTCTNLFDDPNVGGWVANMRDITERKASEAALLEAQEAFRHAFDDAPIGMGLTDVEGNLLRVNRAMSELLGRADGELVGMNVLDVTHPDDRPATLERRKEMSDSDEATRVEKRFLRKDGSTVWVALSLSNVRDADGGVMYQIGQMEDITDRK